MNKLTRKELKKIADKILREDGFKNKNQKTKWIKKKIREKRKSK